MALSYPAPGLSSGAVTLRPWRDEDLACVEQAATDPRIPAGTTVPAVFTREAGLAFIARQRRRIEDGEGISLAITEDDVAVGLLWLGVRPQPRVVGLGYWVVPAARGRGIGTRAARLAAGWALDHAGMQRVEAWVAPVNAPSQRLLASAGFTYEGRLRAFLDGGKTDALVFARTYDDELRGTAAAVGVPRRELLRVVKDLNGIVVSLDRIGSAVAFDGADDAATVLDYTDRADLFARLAVARSVLSDALFAELDTEAEELALEDEIKAGSTYWPQLGEPVVLALTDDVRAVLVRLLEVALEAKAGARVIDLLGEDPWGDLPALVEQVYKPLEAGRSEPGDVTITAYEVRPLLAVLEGLGESYSGGVPWVELDPVESYVVRRVLDRLRADEFLEPEESSGT
ncbi:GNAT family N-acetyltransferase [Solirubrobacter phytolaccae]|uniref:GNAT family N-acetyltransferase n=1 Tax=Solirubrobacter phytolaccae TaxID=1404360 RepID=A0A9X3N438_9ACTN|nr:GNAT family N-acetyltransferase [Solirubrobacter phytolaccae]MDA0179363.1 GNAT family N-acetyltransferase [Solirubrobacter phytolaccae]